MNLIFLFVYLMAARPVSAEEILQKTSDILNRNNSISYIHERDYYTGEKHYFLKGQSFMDFNFTDTIIRMKYLIESEFSTFVFNGSETFSLDKIEKKMKVNYRPRSYDMEGGSFFYNSLVTLRRTLPAIISDQSIRKSLKDTVIEEKSYHMVTFWLRKNTLNSFGGFSPISEDRTFQYRLVISKDSFLPLILKQSNSVDEHTSLNTYTNINFNPVWDEKKLYFSNYLPEYKIEKDKDEIEPLPVGVQALKFELPLFESGKKVDWENYKGKIVLLEFWIRNCGPCIESVPKLNLLFEKYRDKGLEVLAINAMDTKATVDYFVRKYKPAYPIAYMGERVSKLYGVSGFPTAFILNKEGKVIYSGGFDFGAIEVVLDKVINNP
jgi:thiol-disulfide isomerase/thioredoxin